MRTHINIRFILPVLVCSLCSLLSTAQSPDTLSPEQFRSIVMNYHPVAKQATILQQKAKADLVTARGGFDPMIRYDQSEKTFDGTQYYMYRQPELKLPVWFGIDLVAGTENLSGNRTDPQETKGQSNYAGISIPLARDLLMDKRRAALKTAQVMVQSAAAERRSLLNDLLYEAMNAYWNWVMAYQDLRVIREVVNVNQQRMDWIVRTYKIGERPAIDTTEALSQLQSFRLAENQAQLEFRNAGILLSAYLWNERTAPVMIGEEVIPAGNALEPDLSVVVMPEIAQLTASAMQLHPDLKQYDLILNALRIEQKLKFQDQLPNVRFKYNQLGKGYDFLKQTGPLFTNNFRYGISLSMPLRLSEGRGQYQKAKLKVKETELDQQLKSRAITNKIGTAVNEQEAIRKQLNIQESAYRNYNALLRAEETRFREGESSLFLVNARENKALEAKQKWLQLKVKWLKSQTTVQWAAGQLFQ